MRSTVQFSDQIRNLRIELDMKSCQLPDSELQRMERAVGPLADPVRDFPVSELYMTVIHHQTPDDYHVRASLVLPKRTLFTGDRDKFVYPAWTRCIRKLVKKVTAYKEQLSLKSERTKTQEGTVQEVLPTQEPDAEELRRALQENDYAAFRGATLVYEESVRKRAGRWIKRYPEFQATLGESVTLADLVEEVFLNAFEHYGKKPHQVRLGKWLEDLIDPSVKALLRDPEAEQENIDAVRTWRESAGEGQ
jgi:hypothetical protein